MTIVGEQRSSFIDGALWFVLLGATAALLGVGCARTARLPDEMSADAHRQEARGERLVARAHRAAGKHEEPTKAIGADPAGLPVPAPAPLPGESGWHLLEAARHRFHARQHEAAAHALEHAEESECRGVAGVARAACPMLLNVTAVMELDNGVRVRFRPETNVAQVASLMRCHLAYAAAHGFDRVAACPLYVRGVQVREMPGSASIEVIGGSPEAVAEIHGRIHEVVGIAAGAQD